MRLHQVLDLVRAQAHNQLPTIHTIEILEELDILLSSAKTLAL
jgi:hypothetical protein